MFIQSEGFPVIYQAQTGDPNRIGARAIPRLR